MTYEFDDLVVDPAAFRLSRAGQAVHIEPKALQILIFLLERRERLVTKQELLDGVWPAIAVTENALTRAVAQLRKTLRDDASDPRYIETVPTRGYRFIGTLRTDHRMDPPPALAPPPMVVPRRTIPKLLLSTLVIIAAVAMGIVVLRRIPKMLAKPHRVTSREDRPPMIAATRLRASTRLQVSPSFSPDGASVVYCSEVDGVPHLFITPVDGGEERQLTRGDGEAQPAWSPDGKRIAFTGISGRGIWLADVESGALVRLTSFGSRPAWSADSSEIAFQSSEEIEYGWNAYDALPPSTLWIVDVASQKTTALTKSGEPAGGHGAPSWRDDGKRIAFSSCDHERCGIFTIGRDASGLTQLTTDSRRLSSPVYAPGGRGVYAVLSRYNESNFFEIPVDADGNRIGNVQGLRASNPGVIQYVAVSRDGARFVWSVVEEKNDLFSVEIASRATKKLTDNSALNATFPSYSPDGRKIAYCAVGAGEDSGIWIADADGRNPKALVIGPGLKQYARWGTATDVFYAAWSVEQNRALLFRASLRDGRTSVAAELPHGAAAPAISPDLQTVAFNRTIEGKPSVWISALDGSNLRRMSEDADLARFPSWSPHGTSLAVQLRRDTSAVAILPGPRIVVAGGEGNWPHSWSPDGKEIAFAGRRDGVWNVWTVNVANGSQRKVTGFASSIGWVRTPSWSPDGKHIVFESGRPSGNVWISQPRVAQ